VDVLSNLEVGADVSMLLIGADVRKYEGPVVSTEPSLLVIVLRVGGGEEMSLILASAGVVAIPMTVGLVASVSLSNPRPGALRLKANAQEQTPACAER
jgi:hypothetical protein